jgi:tRNA threonylcarbamoyladenosine biosynthesis protein TsaB
MKILAVDTSTPFASISISVNRQIVAESLVSTNRTLSARIIPEIERLLATVGLTIPDIDIFAASIGPGSFTGIRGGVATIQGLALACGKPCAGFSSLTALAMNFPLSQTLVCPLLDARKSEVYGALYDCSSSLPTAHLTDCVLPPTLLLDQINALTDRPIIFAGDGAICYRQLIAERLGDRALFAPYTANSPRSASGILLVHHAAVAGELLEPRLLLPIYLRASDAEIMKLKTPAVPNNRP